METAKGKTSEIKFLASIIHESTSLRGKMAILTYQNLTHSSIADKIVVFYEHYQCVILFVFSNYNVFTKRNNVSANIIDVVFPILFSSSPVNFLPQTEEGTTTNIIVCCLGVAFFVFKMLVFGYMMVCASRNWTPSKHIQHIWQWIFKLQPRVLYYLMTPIYATVAESTFKHLLDLSDNANMTLRMVCILMFASEFTFSLVLQTQFICILPIKSFLASKNNITQILTLLMKFCNHLVRKLVTFAPLVALWIVNMNSLFLGSVRLYLYFKHLPAYNIDCLFYEMYFLVIVLALSMSCILQVWIGESTMDMNLLVGIWIILSLFLIKISRNYLKKKLLRLIMLKENKETSPQVLIHKIMTIKYFLKKGILAEDQVTDYSWESLVKSSLTTDCIIGKGNNYQLENKESRNKLFSLYLEELLARFPKNNFVRLYAAYHFSSKQRLYSKCLITIHKLKQSNSWAIDASLSVLFHGIKERIRLEAHNKTFLFDVSEYALSTSSLAKARLEIMDQLELQGSFYKEMKETCPSLDKLNRIGNKIIQKKREIEKNRKRLFQVIPEYFLEPILLYAHYELVMNHSQERFSEYHERYSKRYQKYAKTFISDHFCQENLYKKNTHFLILSGEKGTQGKVLHCGGDYKEILGRNVTGQYMGATVPTITMTDPKAMFNFILENGEKTILNRLQKRHLWNNQEGFMTEVEYFLNISPFLSQGLIYYVIFRPIKVFQECILVNKEGGIECFTKGIGKELNLFSLYKLSSNEEKNIGKICPELQLANEAFNLIGNSSSPKKLISSLDEAKEIYANYSSADEKPVLYLEKVNNTNDENLFLEENKFTYRCTRIVPLTNNIHGAKEIYLERIIEKNSKETLCDVTKRRIIEKEIHNHKITESDDDLPVDEKEAGWINLEKLQTDYIHPTLQSPVSTARNLLTTRSPRKGNKFTFQTEEREVQKRTATQDSNSFAGVLSHHESVFSLKSEYKSRNKMKKQRAFEQAVNTPYDSPRCRMMALLFFVILLAAFGIQLSSNIRIRQGFSDFGLNKDIVLYAESRNYYAANLNLVLSFYYGEGTQFFNISDVIPQANAMIFLYYISGAAGLLREANLNLSRFANLVNDAQREVLFSNNVNLYDIDYGKNSDDESFHSFSSFQAINQIIETALKVKSLVTVDLSQTFPYLKFCIVNILNDIWVKGNVIVENFYAHLQDNKDDFLQSLTLTFIGIILVPTLGLFAICGFIFAQYNTDRNNLLALTKINRNAIDALSSNLVNFKSFLEQNTNFEKLLKEEKTLKLFKNAAKSEKTQQPLSDTRSINPGRFIKDYIVLILKVLLMLTFLTVSFSIYFAIFSRNLKQMGEKAYQLYFLEKAASRVILLRGGFFNMVLTNNTELLTNRDGNVVLAEQIEKLQDVQIQFQNVFRSDTSTENDIVQDMLFNDVCKYFQKSPSTYSDCKKLGNYQDKLSWLNLMSNTRQKYQEYLAKYEALDKTNESLKELLKDFIGNWMQTSVIVTMAVNNILIDAIDAEFTDMNNRSNALNNRMIIIYIFVVFVAGLIGFWGVLRPIRAKENKFKQFLLLFPANTILSNFILKSFLMKISKSSFDSIMHEM